MDKQLIVCALAPDITDAQLVGQMRAIKTRREVGTCSGAVCLVCDFDQDPRDLWNIPEVAAFCRRLVDIGFISYLDFFTAMNPDCKPPMSASWGAMEVWMCSAGLLGKYNILTPDLLDKFRVVLDRANATADATCGPMLTKETN